ncbi:MAG: hypothetical protein ABIO36_06740 [Pyrinomonadaceae bacterium]
MHVKLTVDEINLDKTSLSDYYANKPLASEIVFMQTNKYRCPHTKQFFAADDIGKAVFFAAK